jgi:hypothetical protein
MTLRYAPHSPDYLVESAAALEKLLQDVIAGRDQTKDDWKLLRVVSFS